MKIQANYTDTLENLTFFATAKGWRPKLVNEFNEEIDNPETLEMFLQRVANEHLLNFISQPITAYLEEQAMENLNNAKQGYLENFKHNLEVVIE